MSEANARVCQAIHRLGLGRALRRPEVNLTVSGGQRLFDHIREDKGVPVNPNNPFSPKRFECSAKDRAAAASKR